MNWRHASVWLILGGLVLMVLGGSLVKFPVVPHIACTQPSILPTLGALP